MRSGKLVLLLLLVPSLAFAQAWPNEPSGATVLLDCPFTSVTCNGALNDPYQTAGRTTSIVTDSSGPVSPPSALRSTENYQSGKGGTELQWQAPSPITEIFVGYWWKTNPEFTGNQVNANKTLFIRGSGGGTNGVFYLRTNPGQSKVLYWSTQLANNLNQCFGAPDQDHCFPNVTTTPFIPGVWHRIEIYMKASSCPTCRDGIARWWVNGVLNGNFLNFAYGPRVDTVVWSETWDGAGNGAGFTSDPSHYIDHLRISAPNCPNGCQVTGGGTTPPPPSPTPPPAPTNPGTVSDLTVTPQSATTAKMTFTAVHDGAGNPAKYDNRLALSPISWGAAASISVGTCASPFMPSNAIGQQIECLITGLSAGQSYQLQNVAFRGTMNAGAVYGSLGNIASFTMPSSNVPAITNFTPASGVTGTSVTIAGSNFGVTVGANTVKFNGQTATITAASATSLTVTAPDGVTTGKISVQTDQGIVYSEQNFTVGASGSGCGCS